VAASSDPYDLERFVIAQNPVFEQVRAELRDGRKQSHWIWFIFPQLKGLGTSAMANEYGIGSRGEAVAYVKHATLGPRLRECTQLVNAIEGRPLRHILGSPDDLKFRSSMTLFALVAGEDDLFQSALQKYCGGEMDQWTIDRLASP
jgi:uncharacterized protein (DUF1810 family)